MADYQGWPPEAIAIDEFIQRHYPQGSLAGVHWHDTEMKSLKSLWVEVDQKTPTVLELLTRELRSAYGNQFDLDFWTDGDKAIKVQEIEKVIHKHEPEGEVSLAKWNESGDLIELTVYVPYAYFWLMAALETDLHKAFAGSFNLQISTPMGSANDN